MDFNTYDKKVDKAFDVVNTGYNVASIIGKVLLFLFFAVVGAGLLIFGVYKYNGRMEAINTYTLTSGTVIEMKEQVDHEGDKTYSPIVNFTASDGKEYKYYSSNSSYPPAYKIGEKVEVYYDPADPQESQMNSFMELWMTVITLIGTGAILIIVGLVMLISTFRKKKKVSTETAAPYSGSSYVNIG